MPTFERRTYLMLLINENNKKNEQMEEMNNTSSKGRRSKRVSGEALKNKLRSGEIPNT